MSNTNDLLVPLTVLALEVDASADELAARLGARVILDDIGRRCVERSLAGVTIAAFHAEREAQRERNQRRRDEAAARFSAARDSVLTLRRRLKARSEAQAELVATGLPASAVATAADTRTRLDASSARLDEMLHPAADGIVYHPVRREG